MFPQVVIYLLYFSSTVLAKYTPSPRWAQAVALLNNTLYVHGGLSDPFNSYSYSSAPEISDLLALDLSTSFDSSSPPWQLFSNNHSPALAWHTLSAFDPTEILLFGGRPDPGSSTVLTTLNDSSVLLSTSQKAGPSFLLEPQNWANEPMRRIRHSSSYASGKVWLIGGEKADGSGNAFSDHYSFNPAGPEFAQLPPSSDAPPDIYGHASLGLPDGRLLVLGGYCASCSDLVPMNTVWSLDTSRIPPVWEKLTTSNESLPDPRRDFAAVALSNGQVLVHGGGDAQLQKTYSDGWILDTRQDPMVWNSVNALEQLGQRKDHFAVQAGGNVLFCFGYGSSSPASASLFIYNPSTSSMVSSYTAPCAGSTPAITSLPASTQTGSKPNPSGGAGTVPGSPPGTPSHPSGSSHSVIAIALGTTFGVLGLVAGGFAALYYVRRVRNRDKRKPSIFFPLADDPESDGSVAGAAPEMVHLNEGQTNKRVMGLTDILRFGVNRSRFRSLQPRKDMFADEDTRSFSWRGRSRIVRGQDSEGQSVWSLRSVSTLVRGVIGGEPSGSGVDREWEKIDHSCEDGLIRQGSLHSNYSSHLARQKDGSSWSYTDPFEDPIRDEHYDGLDLRPGVPEKDADYDRPVMRSNETDDFEWSALEPKDSVWPLSVGPHVVSSLNKLSHTCLSDTSNSLPSLEVPSHGQTALSSGDNLGLSPPNSPTSYSSDPHTTTSLARYSVISGSTLSPSQSISRRDYWWTRLTRPLLDRRTSMSTSKPLDFRDPTPAAPLVTLKERKMGAESNETPDEMPAGHGKSVSSAHSGRTANTDSAAHLGETYDVVQRLASDGSSSRRALSLGSAEITEQGMLAVDEAPCENSKSTGLPHVDPPRSALFALDGETPNEPVLPTSNPASPKGRGMVAGRVGAYERRMSRELESQEVPAPRNTRHREEVPSRTRPTIEYGVAPRASLFIANPDLGHIS